MNAPQSREFLRPATVSGLVGGAVGAAMSALVNYTAIGMPSDVGANAVNHATSGLVSGFLGGFISILVHQRKAAKAQSQHTTAGEAAQD